MFGELCIIVFCVCNFKACGNHIQNEFRYKAKHPFFLRALLRSHDPLNDMKLFFMEKFEEK